MKIEISEAPDSPSTPLVLKPAGLKDLAKNDGIKVGLYRTRLTITLVMGVHFFAYLFIEGPIGYLSGFK